MIVFLKILSDSLIHFTQIDFSVQVIQYSNAVSALVTGAFVHNASDFNIALASSALGLIAVLYRALPDFLTRSAHFDINFHATGIAAHTVAHTAAHFPISIILASLPCCSIGFTHP